MLLMAAWDDEQVIHDARLLKLHRGQLIASVSYLSKRWKKNRKAVMTFLKILTEEGMICRQILHRSTAIITICNYDSYQQRADTLGETLGDSLRDSIGDSLGDTNKEYKENKKERITTTSSTTQSEKEKDLNISEYYSELKSDEGWLEAVMQRHVIPSVDEAKELIEKFRNENLSNGKSGHTTLSDAKRHFCSWLRIYQRMQIKLNKRLEKTKNHVENRSYNQTSGRGYMLRAEEVKDYSGTF